MDASEEQSGADGTSGQGGPVRRSVAGFKTAGEYAGRLKERLEADREKLRAKYGGQPPPEPEPLCPTCGGAGYLKAGEIDVIRHIYETPLVPCPDCPKTVKAERIYRIAKRSGLEDFAGATFDTMAPLPGQEESWEVARGWAEQPAGWLWLEGRSWTGKTTLARLIANFWIHDERPVVMRDVPTLLTEMKGSFDEGAEERFEHLLGVVKRVPHLILDDYGQQNPTPFARDVLFQVTDWRIEREMPTVVTTNVTLDELKSRDSRLWYRVSDVRRSLVIHFDNPPISFEESAL